MSTPTFRDLLRIPEGEDHLLLDGHGQSKIFGPVGEVLSQPIAPDVEGIVYATVASSVVFREPIYDAQPFTVPPNGLEPA
ncbi:MAG: hypothetical protein WBG53_11450 [Rhodococcus sp. (in: high G+C Gram-positive bacteria)]|uniref:hypothetical protein n=1 Tax=unclassified Rhodococcus (in: high G+C Gram-positive bacteria) TaxID=192944 RepID=UPI000EF8AEF7|nr:MULTISPECIES: hypothetical protein [unclassified Rhodococcus (in: high G+C Gram-positive bacteria)]RMB78118.1 hypothetical protein AYK61_18390 [Rhodococcus sp. SBT000017]